MGIVEGGGDGAADAAAVGLEPDVGDGVRGLAGARLRAVGRRRADQARDGAFAGDDVEAPARVFAEGPEAAHAQPLGAVGGGRFDRVEGADFARAVVPVEVAAVEPGEARVADYVAADDGAAGEAYRFYRAAFDRTPDLPGLGFWIGAMDKGSSVQDLAAGFATSKEFNDMYGGASNADIVNRLYHNVLHRTPEQAGYDYWLHVLDNKQASLPDVLAAFSDSAENKDAVADLIASGILFTPWQG